MHRRPGDRRQARRFIEPGHHAILQDRQEILQALEADGLHPFPGRKRAQVSAFDDQSAAVILDGEAFPAKLRDDHPAHPAALAGREIPPVLADPGKRQHVLLIGIDFLSLLHHHIVRGRHIQADHRQPPAVELIVGTEHPAQPHIRAHPGNRHRHAGAGWIHGHFETMPA